MIKTLISAKSKGDAWSIVLLIFIAPLIILFLLFLNPDLILNWF
jgi:hypothetical protein